MATTYMYLVKDSPKDVKIAIKMLKKWFNLYYLNTKIFTKKKKGKGGKGMSPIYRHSQSIALIE